MVACAVAAAVAAKAMNSLRFMRQVYHFPPPVGNGDLIQESEQPKRYFIAVSNRDFVIDHVTVGQARNLRKALSLATDLKCPFPVYHEIAYACICNGMIFSRLAEEIRFTLNPHVYARNKRSHEIRIVHVYLFWL